MKKQLTNTLIIASITVALVLSILFFVPSNGSHWIAINNDKNTESYLATECFFFENKTDENTPVMCNGNKILFYDSLAKRNIILSITLPGEIIDYYWWRDLYVTVKNNNKTQLLIYQILNGANLIKTVDVDCSHFVNSFASKEHDYYGLYALQSEDKCKMILFDEGFTNIYEYKSNKPFVKIDDLSNNRLVFDGKRIFNIYNPKTDICRFDYAGFEKEKNMLDFTKPVSFGLNWFYNINLFLTFDSDTHKITAACTIKDALAFEQVTSMEKGCQYYKIVTKNGLYLSNGASTVLIEKHNLKPVIGDKFANKYFFEIDGGKSKIFSFESAIHSESVIIQNYILKELGSVPGIVSGIYDDFVDLYAYTSEGVFLYPGYRSR